MFRHIKFPQLGLLISFPLPEPIPTAEELCASLPAVAHASFTKTETSVTYTCDPGTKFQNGQTSKDYECDRVSLAPIYQCGCKSLTNVLLELAVMILLSGLQVLLHDPSKHSWAETV